VVGCRVAYGRRKNRLHREIDRMAAVCEVCHKGPMFGHNVSHAHNVTRKVFHPNLQRVRVRWGNNSRRARVCTRCIRSGRVQKVVR